MGAKLTRIMGTLAVDTSAWAPCHVGIRRFSLASGIRLGMSSSSSWLPSASPSSESSSWSSSFILRLSLAHLKYESMNSVNFASLKADWVSRIDSLLSAALNEGGRLGFTSGFGNGGTFWQGSISGTAYCSRFIDDTLGFDPASPLISWYRLIDVTWLDSIPDIDDWSPKSELSSAAVQNTPFSNVLGIGTSFSEERATWYKARFLRRLRTLA